MSNWREQCPVMVMESNTVGSLAVVRSLGRAGYPVVAAAAQENALAFRSRYCGKSRVHPAYADARFHEWLDHTLHEEKIQLIIPSESFLLAIRQRFAQLAHLLPTPPDERLTYQALSKFDLFKICADGGLKEHLPPYLLVDQNDATPEADALRALGEPIFVKMDSSYAKDNSSGGVVKCKTAQDAVAAVERLRPHFSKILLQGYVSGVGVGAFSGRWKDHVLGEFMHRRIHEVPHWGGASSFRESWRHDKIMADARKRAALLGWHGVGMFEYRWHPASDQFWLMEFNSRFWGSLHLTLFAGVDFPRLLADAVLGHPSPPALNYALVRSRLTFPREIEYVFSCVKDRTLPWGKRLWPIAEFFGLSLNPHVYSDLNFPGDRALYAHMFVRSIRRFLS